MDESRDGWGERAALRHHATAAGGIFAMLAHELERRTAGSDATAMEGKAFPWAPSRGIRACDDGEEIAPDTTASGHDDCTDERSRDRRVHRVAARCQHTQSGR